MAHPYSSNPYAGAPSYPPQQQSFYPSYPSNGLQQQVQTPPGLVQQPSQGQGQPQSFPAYHQQQQQQPSPSTNGPRFEQNSQIPPSAVPFPPFPPPPINFNSDFFKQFANAGFPPPPPPNIPPVPLPSPGYPQLHAAVNTSTSSPYPQFHYAQNEQPQLGGNQYMGAQEENQSGMEWQRGSRTYAAPAVAQAGDSHNVRPISRGLISLGNDKDQSLPSFGSRSDLDMLFATAQHQMVQAPPTHEEAGISQDANRNDSTDHDLLTDGGASPYDPTRPATIEDRPSGSFAPASIASKASVPKKMERIYDNKSHAELRQLAKGAVLSLVPHKILYADLVKEGVDPQILRELYGELGLKVEPEQPQPRNDDIVQNDLPSQAAQTPPSTQKLELQDHESTSRPNDTQAVSLPPAANAETILPPAVVDVRKQQSAPSPSLERKDRIAQLLAAKAGRPSPSPVAQTSTLREESTAPAPTATSAATSEVAAAPSTSATPPASQPEAATSTQSITVNKSKAQTELVKQKMEQLKRETQARSDATSSKSLQAPLGTPTRKEADVARAMPQFGSVTPLSATKVSSFFGQPSVTSLIPGLFMSSTETPAVADSAIQSSPFQATSSSNVPTKRSLDDDTALPAFQPPAKKSNVQQNLKHAPSAPPSDNDLDYQSEGEVVEDAEDDAMTLDQVPEQAPQQEYQPRQLSDIAPYSYMPAEIDQAFTAPLQTASNNGPGSDHLYRAKQTEIEAMRQRIAEMERKKLKRTKSQLESPASSKPTTPPVARQEQPLISSPISQTADLTSTQRQPPNARTTSKLTREQLLERAATLKAEVLKQRAQRQQVLQDGLPDLNAEVKNTETQLHNSRQELVQVRAQIQSLRAELDRLAVQEKELDGEVIRFEQQLEEGREGQKQYSDELRLIKLEKLAEEQADPVQQASGHAPRTQPETAAGEDFPGWSNEEPNDQETMPQDNHTLSDDGVEDADAAVIDDEGDTEMQVEEDDDFEMSETEGVLHNAPEVAPVLEAGSEHHQEMQGDFVDESPVADYVVATTDKEAEVTDTQIQAADEDQLGAGEMEISPGPEDFVESHESLPPPVETVQESADDALRMDDDSDGSASMSDSDDEEEEYEPAEADSSVPLPEEEYEPAEPDTSVPMQHSDDEGEYDPETAPVESGASTTGIEENDDVYDPATFVGVPSSALAHAEQELPVNGDSAVASNATESPAQAEIMTDDVPAVSEVPANTKDDLESHAQLAEADATGKPPPGHSENVETGAFLDGGPAPSVHYVPYKTPLSSFKTYRFHADFNDTVKSGYRSLTYSNSIDPSRPLCPTELSGQTCTDTTCEDQHFSQLGLPDEKILVQMSSASDIKDKATRDDFHAGLKLVITGLRANDIKDFEKVADALSKYRREFFAERAKEATEVEDKVTKSVTQDAEEGRIGENPSS
ncbi:hypothetical protein H2200_003836 [Cladophialophora chaetospira]|uniref:Putative zinc-finger domain-containing protein n=1 Tax=Cladophialophora chaetospira TaxID=386627 RepID=A0AA38XF13_9EURO|nr:hypothetical protein H2200_003836 [Cladophialophora chaetospira]